MDTADPALDRARKRVFLPLGRWERREVQQLFEKERERDIIHH